VQQKSAKFTLIDTFEYDVVWVQLTPSAGYSNVPLFAPVLCAIVIGPAVSVPKSPNVSANQDRTIIAAILTRAARCAFTYNLERWSQSRFHLAVKSASRRNDRMSEFLSRPPAILSITPSCVGTGGAPRGASGTAPKLSNNPHRTPHHRAAPQPPRHLPAELSFIQSWIANRGAPRVSGNGGAGTHDLRSSQRP